MSDNHLHLAAKWRPQTFNDVVGQEAVVDSLRGMIMNKRVDPVLIFHGPYSTGKTTLARLVAYYINCQKPNGIEPCGECTSCKQMKPVLLGRSEHPDITELNVALHGGIDEIRRLASIAPQAPRYNFRVFILDEAHQITGAAFQAMLKLLEDPPRRTRYILCTTNYEKLPSTIRSRGGVFALQPLPTEIVAKRVFQIALNEGFKPPKDMLKKLCLEIAAASDGHLRDALGLLTKVINCAKAAKSKGTASNWQELITEVVQQSAELQTSEVVRRYVGAVVKGNIAEALKTLKHVTNTGYFTQQVIETFQQLFYSWIDGNTLCDRGKSWMLRGIELTKKPTSYMTDFPKILDDYCTVLERIKLYSSDSLALLEASTFRTLVMIQSW
jgi:DNA polymerase-3 subunit gamma/tau